MLFKGSIWVALLAVGLQLMGSISGASSESCHMREFDLCMASAVVFVQQPQGIKATEAEIERQCALFKETEDCLNDYEERCMTPMQQSLIDFMSGGLLAYMRSYCKKGSETRTLYLKHADCVGKQRKATNNCLIDFQAALERSTEDGTHWKDRPKMMCCALDRMKTCNAKVIEPACGKEAVEVGNTMMRATFSRAASLTCNKYHNSPECKKLLPPEGTKPKGSRSTSVLSKLMSTATQI